MKWWQASLVVVLLFLLFASAEVGWHRYIATGLPLATAMRHFYLSRPSGGRYRFNAIPDWLIPTAVLAVMAGAASRRQRPLFVVAHVLWLTAGMVALFPLYTHWLYPQPPDWREYPMKWNVAVMTYLFCLACVGLGAFVVRGNLRNQLGKAEKRRATRAQSKSDGPSTK